MGYSLGVVEQCIISRATTQSPSLSCPQPGASFGDQGRRNGAKDIILISRAKPPSPSLSFTQPAPSYGDQGSRKAAMIISNTNVNICGHLCGNRWYLW
jgi:hypothetical protein